MKDKISVIIPIYNREKTIKKCINSVLNQTYNNYEIIVIDDGSTDKGAEICKRMIESNNKIKYFYQKNNGVSSARNKGIDLSNGEYIVFIDSDDYIDKDYLEKLVSKIKSEKCDFVLCQFNKVDENERIIFRSTSKKYGKLNKKETLQLFFINELSISSCCKIFKKSFIENIRFNEKYKNNEDKLFVFECLKKMSNCYVLKYYGYNYLENTISASNNISVNVADNMLEISNIINDYATKYYPNYSNLPIVLTELEIYRTFLLKKANKSNKEYLKRILCDLKIRTLNYKLIYRKNRIIELKLLKKSKLIYALFLKIYIKFKKVKNENK